MFWLLVGATLIILFYIYLIRPFTYWSRKGVAQRSVFNIWADTANLFLRFKAQAELISEIYNEYPDKRYNGSYQFLKPVLYLRDPDLIKQITVKDFDHFVDRSQIIREDLDPLWGKNLFALRGDRWREMRSTLSPSFTSSKMRAMFVLVSECAEQFVQHFKKHDSSQGVEMKNAFTRFANDVIATTAFGVTCDSLTNPNNEFYLMGKKATNSTGFWTNLKFFMIFATPNLARIFRLKVFPSKVSTFFRRLVKTNIESREKNGVIRPDMIQLLIEARNGRVRHEEQSDVVDSSFAVVEESSVGKKYRKLQNPLSDDDLTAQALIFFFAGFDSISTLLSFLSYELAVNPDVQEVLRKEVDKTLEKCESSVTYEALVKMKYMDMVVSEGLRKWSAVLAVDRICVKPYTIQPVKEGEMPLRIDTGDLLWLPIFGIHRNPENYLNPDRFDPERFSDENKVNIRPYSYIPFGSGPRSCIGNRFALLETKTILFYLLSNFELIVTKETSIPLKLRKDQFTLAAEGGIWIGLKPRSVKLNVCLK